MKLNFIKTVVAVIVYSVLLSILGPVQTIEVSNAAVGQLANSDGAYYSFNFFRSLFEYGRTALTLLFLGYLLFVWRAQLAVLYQKMKDEFMLPAVILLAGGLMLLNVPNDARAYYDKTDRGEYIEIQANESAFLIPMNGANKDTQSKFGSIEYLNANKIPVKRIQIPHVKADNTGMFTDYYIPGAKLYVLDRTPVHREWVAHATRGTTDRDESFRFESSESINVSTGIVITTFVKEEDAANFFYWFGAEVQKSSSDPIIMFASVVRGKSLATVVDTVVRAQVQASLAKEFGKRPLDKGIAEKAIIIETVLKDVQDQFTDKGITISTLGYAESLSFDKAVQEVINDNYIATKKLQYAPAYYTSLEIEMKEAQISVVRAEAATIQKWNGQINLPSFMLVGDSLVKWVEGIFGGSAPIKVAESPAKK